MMAKPSDETEYQEGNMSEAKTLQNPEQPTCLQ